MRAKRYKWRKKKNSIILLAMLAVVVTFFAYPHFYSALINIELDPSEIIEIASHGRQEDFSEDFAIYDGKLLYLQRTGLKLFDREGNIIWENKMDIENPFLGILQNRIIVSDINRGIIYGINNEGKSVWEYQPSGKIQGMGVDKNYIWIKGLYNDKNIIEIINWKGENTGHLSVGKTEITGVSVSFDGENVVISTLGIQGKHIVSSLSFYKKNGAILWAQKYNDNIILGLTITDKNDILVLNEKRLVSVNKEGNIQWYHQLDRYVTRALLSTKGEALITLAEDYRSGIPGTVEEETLFFDHNGEKREPYLLQGKVVGLAQGEDYLAVFASREMKLIDYQGIERVNMKFDKDISRVFLLEDKSMAYLSGENIFFSTIK